jgi:hypothetical protein
MTPQKRTPENSVTNEIIRKVHLSLADLKSGEEILNFLRTTEPLFMEEVNRFIQTEMARMKYTLSDNQVLYIGSVIGATYIAGFLISREASSQMFNGLVDIKSAIRRSLSPEEIDKIIDKERDEGKSYKEISKLIKHMITQEQPKKKKMNKIVKKNIEKEKGKRLDLGDLS